MDRGHKLVRFGGDDAEALKPVITHGFFPPLSEPRESQRLVIREGDCIGTLGWFLRIVQRHAFIEAISRNETTTFCSGGGHVAAVPILSALCSRVEGGEASQIYEALAKNGLRPHRARSISRSSFSRSSRIIGRDVCGQCCGSGAKGSERVFFARMRGQSLGSAVWCRSGRTSEQSSRRRPRTHPLI